MSAFDFATFFRSDLDALRDEGRYRVFADLERLSTGGPYAWDYRKGRVIAIWCSNDYLAMGVHPDVLEAARQAIEKYGAGAGGTRNISGTSHEHVLLERDLADLHGKDAALLFTSGYAANDAALSTLGKRLPGAVIFSDALNHASMIEGMRRSGAERRVFAHNDWRDLERQMDSVCRYRPKLVCFESCYSMDGDFAPIAAICDIAEQHGAFTYLDEVHAVGLYGEHGAGVAERDGQSHRISMIQGTLSKGFGAMGGYVAGDATAVDFVRSHAPGFIFSTALPPAVVASVRAALRHLKADGGPRRILAARAASIREGLRRIGLPLLPSPSHILPVMIGDAATARDVTDFLMEDFGVYIQPVNFPTVPRGTERLRITPTPLHADEDEEQLLEALAAVWRKNADWRRFSTAAMQMMETA